MMSTASERFAITGSSRGILGSLGILKSTTTPSKPLFAGSPVPPLTAGAYPKAETGAAATHVMIAVEGGQEIVSMLSAIHSDVAGLLKHFRELKEAVAETPHGFCATITTLGPARLTVKKPIPIAIHGGGEDYVASFLDANISASGDTPQEAFRNLCDILVAKTRLFESLPPEKLGREPTRQLAVIREFIALG